MMNFRNFKTLPAQVNSQIDRAAEIWKKYLGNCLSGIYIHGSIALGFFQEDSSDIDILIISERRIPHNERLLIANEIIKIDRSPCPLEMSAILYTDLKSWKHPCRCQFHYSGSWTITYRQLLAGTITGSSIVEEDFPDPDIACHVRLTDQCGICIYGRPIKEVFPVIPENDFWSSLTYDLDDNLLKISSEKDPVKLADNIIVCGRVLSYRHEKKILSKYESAFWTLNHVPDRFKFIIKNVIRSRFYNEPVYKFSQNDLDDLQQYFADEIKG